MEITLDQLLASREARALRQKDYLRDYPDATLVCLTVIMPGKVKRDSRSLIVAGAAVTQMVAVFGASIGALELRDLPTGYEAYMVTSLPCLQAKAETCRIEDSHPLGRLFDLDVIGRDGIPLSRAAVGEPQRKCLLCDNTATFCMRNRTHTQEELIRRIDELIDAYVQ